MKTDVLNDAALLHQVAKDYVTKGLGEKNFDAIPYDDEVELRAPICPGGSAVPLVGKENLRSVWWAPLPSLLGKVTFIDSYVNEDISAVTAEFHCEIVQPLCLLRIVDRFIINQQGKIIAQENFFDPTMLLKP